MLIQHRRHTARYVSQHDHGLHVGALANAWDVHFDSDAILAMSLHDIAWQDADDVPRRAFWFDDDTGTLRDFTRVGAPKLAMYADGLDRAERIHGYSGLLGSMHYALFFPSDETTAPFLHAERARRARLAREIAVDPDSPGVRADYDWLQFFDALSLFACLHAPGSDPATHLPWLTSTLTSPRGTHTLEWIDDDTLTVSGLSPDVSIAHPLPYRELPARFDSADALVDAWEHADVRWWDLVVRGA